MEFLCIDILNSNRVDWQDARQRRDMLEDTEWLRALAAKWQLSVPSKLDKESLNQLKALRFNMYAVIADTSKALAPQQQHLSAINKVLEGTASRHCLKFDNGSFELSQVYDTSGWALLIWHVAHSFAEMLCHYDNARHKICENNNCSWVFYDASKNLSRRWCDNKACGNIMKVRAFRARKKAAAGKIVKNQSA